MKIKTTNIAECELESKNFPGVKGFSKSAEGLSLNSQHKKDLIFVHLATFLFGASGLLPNFVSLHSIIISMVRGLFSVIFIFILLKVIGESLLIKGKAIWLLMALAAALLAGNWVLFTYSIQLSTVGIGTLTTAACPLFLTFIEPLIFKERLRISAVLSAFLMLAGIIIMVPEFSLESSMTRGILWGLLGSFLYAVFSLVNRSLVSKFAPLKIVFWEQTLITIMLIPPALLIGISLSPRDLVVLVIAGILTTAMPHILFINGQKTVSAQSSNVILAVQSIYGCVLALLLFAEVPSIRTVIGGIVILAAAIYSGISSPANKEAC